MAGRFFQNWAAGSLRYDYPLLLRLKRSLRSLATMEKDLLCRPNPCWAFFPRQFFASMEYLRGFVFVWLHGVGVMRHVAPGLAAGTNPVSGRVARHLYQAQPRTGERAAV